MAQLSLEGVGTRIVVACYTGGRAIKAYTQKQTRGCSRGGEARAATSFSLELGSPVGAVLQWREYSCSPLARIQAQPYFSRLTRLSSPLVPSTVSTAWQSSEKICSTHQHSSTELSALARCCTTICHSTFDRRVRLKLFLKTHRAYWLPSYRSSSRQVCLDPCAHYPGTNEIFLNFRTCPCGHFGTTIIKSSVCSSSRATQKGSIVDGDHIPAVFVNFLPETSATAISARAFFYGAPPSVVSKRCGVRPLQSSARRGALFLSTSAAAIRRKTALDAVADSAQSFSLSAREADGAVEGPPCGSSSAAPRVCIVGAGPAGFYCAKYLLQAAAGAPRSGLQKEFSALQVPPLNEKFSSLRVDMLERLPSPYGLVRYGVAPDHPEIKRVVEDFDVVAQNPSFRYFGNVELGKDVTLPELRSLYDAVIVAYGAAGERALKVEGADKLIGCLSARSFVGFYNAHPDLVSVVEKRLPHVAEERGLEPSVGIVVGNGNVSLDVARLLTRHPTKLQPTDMHQPALTWIRRAKLRRVIVLGRRGWVQASFTNKELRELLTGDGLLPVVNPVDFYNSLTDASRQELSKSRLKQRSKVLLEEMMKNWERRDTVDCPVVHLRFLASPVRTLPHPGDPSRLGEVEIAPNHLEGQLFHQRAVRSAEICVDRVPCSLLIWSTGFKCIHPPSVCFPIGKDGALENRLGLVAYSSVDEVGRYRGAVFTSGWARRGPHGVIASNIMDAREVVANVLKQLDKLSPSTGASSRRSSGEHIGEGRVGAASGGSVKGAPERHRQTVSPPDVVASSPAILDPLYESMPDVAAEASGVVTTADDKEACTSSGRGASQGAPASRNCTDFSASFLSGTEKRLESKPEKASEKCFSSSNAGAMMEKRSTADISACDDIATLLHRRGVSFITYVDWMRIKGLERAKGEEEGKAAVKVSTTEEMLQIAKERSIGVNYSGPAPSSRLHNAA